MEINNDTIQEKQNKLPIFVLLFLLLFSVIGIVFILTNNHINWKNLNITTSADVYNEAFDNGVDCGVNALMFYVKQGKKEIDVNEVHNKAIEIRKQKEIK